MIIVSYKNVKVDTFIFKKMRESITILSLYAKFLVL